MKFYLTMVASHVKEADVAKYEKIGFRFQKETDEFWLRRETQWNCLNSIKRDITIDIQSVEELMRFIAEFGAVVVSEADASLGGGLHPTIEIYNDYRE